MLIPLGTKPRNQRTSILENSVTENVLLYDIQIYFHLYAHQYGYYMYETSTWR